MKLLFNHTSPETAYVVDDYPYSFHLRCKIRYWLEYKPNHGFRLMSQTTNPKRSDIWNKPKASTYYKFGGALYLADNGHVQMACLSEYSDGAEAQTFQDTYGAAVPEVGQKILAQWIAAKTAYDNARAEAKADGTIPPLSVGLVEARKAWLEETIKDYPKANDNA